MKGTLLRAKECLREEKYLGRDRQKRKTLQLLKIALVMRHLDEPRHVFPHVKHKEAAGRCQHLQLIAVVKHHT